MESIRLVSFGYNRRTPPEGFLEVDARGITNPEKRYAGTGKTGKDQEVRDYVIGTSIKAQLLMAEIVRLVLEEGNPNIAVGCSWGHHRSVSLVEAAARYIKTITGQTPDVEHMELEDRG